MRPLTIEQLVQQIQTIMKHLRCPGESQDLMHIMLAWAQLATGMGFSLIEWQEKPVPHLECEWTQSLRTGLADIGARIEMTQPFVYHVRRKHDCHIMDAISQCGRFTPNQMRRINGCRLYLQVTLLSDITTACGRHVNEKYYRGERTHRTNWPTVQYPRQNKPDKTSWALW